MVRWARAHRVFFVEEPMRGEATNGLDIRALDCGVRVVVPQLETGLSCEDEQRVLTGMLRTLYDQFDISRPISWYYSPMFLDVTRHLEASVVVYDCMDELSAFRGAPPALTALESELFDRAHAVLTGGQSLYEAKRERHPNVHAFPSSVDVAHFATARTATDPDDQASIPHPRIGFYGVIDERLDIELIRELAALRPALHIVLVGPVVKIDPATLPQAANLHYLGMKSYEELPKYLSGWDVAMLPFAINESTRFISPTKTPEYMAGGRPVISTPIRDVVRPYGDAGLVHIARNAAELVVALDRIAEEDADARRRAHDAFLSDLSWDATFEGMARVVASAAPTSSPNRKPNGKRERHSAQRKPTYDFLIVGAGFSGSVTAERLAAAGHTILLVDRRPHIGGNAYDRLNEHGVLIHEYGPHIFHTASDDVFGYLSRFTEWRPYEHRVLASVEGELLPIPINLDTVNRLYGWNLTSEELAELFTRVAEPRAQIRTSEDTIVSKVGRDLYEKFFRGYTRKQWGLDPSELDASVIARIPVRTNQDDRYFTDAHQAMPRDGYTAMFDRMVRHPNITLALGQDYRTLTDRVRARATIYTGPVDEYFGFCFGELPYRSLEFRHVTLDTEVHQVAPVINYPNEHEHTRVTELKYLTGQQCPKTSIVYEYPRAEGDAYYPIQRPENAALYRR
jgi:UDP-galactopyranose mutase